MKTFEIWSEGWAATGQQSKATFHGEIKAKSFKEACNKIFKDDKDYDEKNGTLWGCMLYDNEKDAREFLG